MTNICKNCHNAPTYHDGLCRNCYNFWRLTGRHLEKSTNSTTIARANRNLLYEEDHVQPISHS